MGHFSRCHLFFWQFLMTPSWLVPCSLQKRGMPQVITKWANLRRTMDGVNGMGIFVTMVRGWKNNTGKLTNSVRQFIKGTNGFAGRFGDIISGSPQVYKLTPTTSINYITCHDGITLCFLTIMFIFSY